MVWRTITHYEINRTPIRMTIAGRPITIIPRLESSECSFDTSSFKVFEISYNNPYKHKEEVVQARKYQDYIIYVQELRTVDGHADRQR